MAIEDLTTYPGDAQTPFELYTARRDVWDYHALYGMPAIIKRTYNSDHVAFGKGPHGEPVERDSTWDEQYGQGFASETSAKSGQNLTGYSDGWLTYVTLDDAKVETSKFGARGAHKELITNGEMPWLPTLWDEDLLILVEIVKNGNTIEIVGSYDRFIVQNVTAVTLRGHFEIPIQETQANYMQNKNHFIAQRFNAVRMPRYNDVYNVPLLGF